VPSLLFGASPERIERGGFTCPDCAGPRAYDRVVVRRTARVLGVLLRFGRWGEYIECAACLATYRPEVLAYDAGAATHRVMAEYQRVMRRVLALMVVTDGRIAEPEIATVRDIFEAVSGRRLSRDDVLDETRAVVRQPMTVARYLAGVLGHLNDYGKEQILRAAAMVARADGATHESERSMVRRLGGVLRVERLRVEAVLDIAG
jgi:uncharacterized tellurite resistance protein B-like protein